MLARLRGGAAAGELLDASVAEAGKAAFLRAWAKRGETAAELAAARLELNGAAVVAQEMIQEPEYSCGTVTLNGHCAGAIVLRRILRRAVRAAVLDSDPGDLSGAENPEAVEDIRKLVQDLR